MEARSRHIPQYTEKRDGLTQVLCICTNSLNVFFFSFFHGVSGKTSFFNKKYQSVLHKLVKNLKHETITIPFFL